MAPGKPNGMHAICWPRLAKPLVSKFKKRHRLAAVFPLLHIEVV